MWKRKKFVYPLAVLLLVSAMFTAVVAIGQGSQTPPKAKKVQVLRREEKVNAPISEQELVDADTPTVDYAAPESSDPKVRARRRANGKRYDHGRPEKVEEMSNGVAPLPISVHWWAGLEALPVAQSDVVVLGEVTDAQAHLSNDKTGVYSEFTIRVDELLKGSGQNAPAAGGSIVAERPGGKVKFPSGKLQRYGIDKQGMPRIGGRYVLFLKANGDGQDFSIVTGYELRDGAVIPLDGARSANGAQLPFDVYRGANEINFLTSLRNSIATHGGNPQ
jgi:hypothetical protein